MLSGLEAVFGTLAVVAVPFGVALIVGSARAFSRAQDRGRG